MRKNAFVVWWIRHRVKLFIIASLCIIIYAIIYNTEEASMTSWGDALLQLEFLNHSKSFISPLENISRGTGRYMPLESQGEFICRQYLENRFGVPFSKQRPLFLRNQVTGKALELDCFNENLGIAVEYNGRQHYEYIPTIHKTREQFYAQQYRDYMKQILCSQHGIVLIIVPYTVHVNDIPNLLEKELNNIDKPYNLEYRPDFTT